MTSECLTSCSAGSTTRPWRSSLERGTTDVRSPHVDTDVKVVLSAVAITTKWLNDHPECGAAAWIMSTVAVEQDYRAQGKGQLSEKAMQAMQDPAYQEITAEYKKNGGLWKTESVVMVTQVMDSLGESADMQNKTAVAEATGSLPWLTSASTQARRNYAQTFKHAAAQPKKELPAPVAEAAERRAKIQKITDAAAQQFKDELAEKKAKAEAKHLELVKQATVEHLRQELGKTKKQKLAPESVQEKLAQACRCSLSLPKGMHKDRCNFHPSTMRALLRANVANRASMEAQLRTRTSLSPHQREAALEYLFGPAVALETGAGAPRLNFRNRRGVE